MVTSANRVGLMGRRLHRQANEGMRSARRPWGLRAAGYLACALLGLASGGSLQAQEVALPGGGTSGGAAATPDPLEELQTRITRARSLADEWSAKASEFEQARLQAAERLQEIEEKIAELRAPGGFQLPRDASLADLEVQLLSAEQDLALARKELASLEAEMARRSERRRKIPELLADAKQRQGALQEETPAGVQEVPALLDARRRLLDARAAALDQEVRAYEQELSSYDSRGKLLDKRLEWARMRIGYEEDHLAKLQGTLTALREGEAQQAAEHALESLEQAEGLTPAVRAAVHQLAQQNAEFAQRRTGKKGLLRQIDSVSRKLMRVEERVSRVGADYERLQTKVEAAGLTDSVGLLLRKKRAEMPDAGKYRRFIRMRQERISDAQMRQIELREQLADLSDVEAVVAETMQRVDPETPQADRAQIRALLSDLLATKRMYLEALLEDYETYFQKLVDFDARQQELIERTEGLLRFIDERILWIPSGDVVRVRLARDATEGLAWLVSPRFVGQLLRATVAVGVDAPIVTLCALLLFGLAIPLRWRVPAMLRAIGIHSREPTLTDAAPTWKALGLSLFLVPWWPALLAFLGWRLGISPDATQYVRCIAHGLVAAALAWASLELVREVLRRDGLAEAHFEWPSQAVRRLRRHVVWITAVLVPAVFLAYVFELRGEEVWKESVGRLVFTAAMVGAAVFMHLVLRERAGALWQIHHEVADAPVRPWTWRILHGAALAVPFFFALSAARGYYWTALQLATSYHFTLVFLFQLLVLLQLFQRWSLLARRRLLLRQYEQTRRVREARARAGDAELADPVSAMAEPEIDLAAVTAQTGSLAHNATAILMVLGLWLIWADLLPALGILDDVDLWNTTQTVQVERTDAAGVHRLESEQRVVPVTLADGLLALIVAFMTLVLVRNLPGFLEISLFRRIGISAGERYAYATIAKYAIALVGGILAFRAVGIGWSNIQWLVAAVGIGLGFGLQEIFANFISGLIILFERPIRVGDTVTVGDVSGKVSRIRIRATWITGFDRKELVVPNKEFVTSRLVNWSLSDAVLRVDIPVGIAYGSDTEKAIQVLHGVAERTPNVLEDPPPVVYFVGFGDSALNFEVRAYSPDVEHLFPIRHELHLAIDHALREAEIEISFPQRDLHLRSVPEEWKARPTTE
jgi:potassium efflux system protein